jgi:hypothetical protein
MGGAERLKERVDEMSKVAVRRGMFIGARLTATS